MHFVSDRRQTLHGWLKRLVHLLTGKLTKRIAWMLTVILGRGGGNRIRQWPFGAREINGEKTGNRA
jgi:hypothetical protein